MTRLLAAIAVIACFAYGGWHLHVTLSATADGFFAREPVTPETAAQLKRLVEIAVNKD